MDSLTITTKEIAVILGITARAVRKRAEKGKWQAQESANQNSFIISCLPEDVKIAITAYQQKQLARHTDGGQALVPVLYPSTYVPALPDPGSRNLPSGARLDKGMAKADLLRLYTQTLEKVGHGRKVHARKEFMRAYNSGIAYPKIFELVGKVHWKTIEGWKRALKNTGETFELCDCRGFCKRGQMPADRPAERYPSQVRSSSKQTPHFRSNPHGLVDNAHKGHSKWPLGIDIQAMAARLGIGQLSYMDVLAQGRQSLE
jgi:putative transposase